MHSKEFAERLNQYVVDVVKYTAHVPYGWCNIGHQDGADIYLGRVGAGDLFVYYNEQADRFIAYYWD